MTVSSLHGHNFMSRLSPIIPGTFLLAALSVCTSCTLPLQRQLNRHEAAIERLDRSHRLTDQAIAQLRAGQADAMSTIDELRIENQKLKGQIEQSAHTRQQELDALRTRVERLSAAPQPAVPEPAAPAHPPAPAAESAQGLYDRAYSLFKNGSCAESCELFQRLLQNFPQSDLADNALYWIAESHYREKNYRETVKACERVITQYSGGNKVPDAYCLQARSFRELGDHLSARILLETVIEKYPSSPKAKEAAALLAELESADSE